MRKEKVIRNTGTKVLKVFLGFLILFNSVFLPLPSSAMPKTINIKSQLGNVGDIPEIEFSQLLLEAANIWDTVLEADLNLNIDQTQYFNNSVTTYTELKNYLLQYGSDNSDFHLPVFIDNTGALINGFNQEAESFEIKPNSFSGAYIITQNGSVVNSGTSSLQGSYQDYILLNGDSFKLSNPKNTNRTLEDLKDDLKITLMHELGHALELPHTYTNGDYPDRNIFGETPLMFPYFTSFTAPSLHQDDLSAIISKHPGALDLTKGAIRVHVPQGHLKDTIIILEKIDIGTNSISGSAPEDIVSIIGNYASPSYTFQNLAPGNYVVKLQKISQDINGNYKSFAQSTKFNKKSGYFHGTDSNNHTLSLLKTFADPVGSQNHVEVFPNTITEITKIGNLITLTDHAFEKGTNYDSSFYTFYGHDDFGDTVADPELIGSDQVSFTARLETTDDVDVFRLVLEEEGTIDIDVAPHAEANLRLELDEQLPFNTTINSSLIKDTKHLTKGVAVDTLTNQIDATLDNPNQTKKHYYLSVSSDTGTIGDYDITLHFTPASQSGAGNNTGSNTGSGNTGSGFDTNNPSSAPPSCPSFSNSGFIAGFLGFFVPSAHASINPICASDEFLFTLGNLEQRILSESDRAITAINRIRQTLIPIRDNNEFANLASSTNITDYVTQQELTKISQNLKAVKLNFKKHLAYDLDIIIDTTKIRNGYLKKPSIKSYEEFLRFEERLKKIPGKYWKIITDDARRIIENPAELSLVTNENIAANPKNLNQIIASYSDGVNLKTGNLLDEFTKIKKLADQLDDSASAIEAIVQGHYSSGSQILSAINGTDVDALDDFNGIATINEAGFDNLIATNNAQIQQRVQSIYSQYEIRLQALKAEFEAIDPSNVTNTARLQTIVDDVQLLMSEFVTSLDELRLTTKTNVLDVLDARRAANLATAGKISFFKGSYLLLKESVQSAIATAVRLDDYLGGIRYLGGLYKGTKFTFHFLEKYSPFIETPFMAYFLYSQSQLQVPGAKYYGHLYFADNYIPDNGVTYLFYRTVHGDSPLSVILLGDGDESNINISAVPWDTNNSERPEIKLYKPANIHFPIPYRTVSDSIVGSTCYDREFHPLLTTNNGSLITSVVNDATTYTGYDYEKYKICGAGLEPSLEQKITPYLLEISYPSNNVIPTKVTINFDAVSNNLSIDNIEDSTAQSQAYATLLANNVFRTNDPTKFMTGIEAITAAIRALELYVTVFESNVTVPNFPGSSDPDFQSAYKKAVSLNLIPSNFDFNAQISRVEALEIIVNAFLGVGITPIFRSHDYYPKDLHEQDTLENTKKALNEIAAIDLGILDLQNNDTFLNPDDQIQKQLFAVWLNRFILELGSYGNLPFAISPIPRADEDVVLNDTLAQFPWPFIDPVGDWNNTAGNQPGQGGHTGFDYFAQDWNYKDGGNSELTRADTFFSHTKAVFSGTVIHVTSNKQDNDGGCPGHSPSSTNYGNQVIIVSDDDPSFAVRYAHLSEIAAGIETGNHIVQNQLVGKVGSSGLLSTDPNTGLATQCTSHLHLALYKNIDQTITAGSSELFQDSLDNGSLPTGSSVDTTNFTAEFEIANQGSGGTNPNPPPPPPPPPPPAPSPSVSSISPDTVNLQETTTFTVSGQNFQSGFEIFIPQCESPSPTSFIDSSTLQITCTPDHGPGSLTVEVKEGPGQAAFDTSLRVAFVDPNASTNPPPPPIPSSPEIVSVSPSSVTLGQETTFTITGSNLPNQLKVFLAQCVDYDSTQIRTVSNDSFSFTCTPGFGPSLTGSGGLSALTAFNPTGLQAMTSTTGLSLAVKDLSGNEIFTNSSATLKVDFNHASGSSPAIYNIAKISPIISGEIPTTRPIDTLLGQEHIFEIYGNNLPDSTAFFIAGCPDPNSGNTVGPEKITDCSNSNSDCSHKQRFRCTPLQAVGPNLQAGVVKDMPGGLELFNFSVNFINDPGSSNGGSGNNGTANPVVTDIDKPSSIFENQRTTLTVNGQDLPDTLVLEITGCNSMQRETAVANTTNARAFSCIPAGTGIKSLTVKTDANQSGSIFSSSIIVSADPNGGANNGGTNPPPPPANPPTVTGTTVTYSNASGQYIFTINITGTDLNNGLYVNIGGRCLTNSNSITSSSSTAMTFSCNGSSIFPVGRYNVSVIDSSSGSSLDFTTIDVINGADDHGDNFSNTTLINLNQDVNGVIGTVGDKDFFEFKAGSRGKFIFESTGSTDVKASLFVKSTGNRVGNGDDNSGQGNNFKINEELLLNETYLLSVFHAAAGLGPYQIKVIEDPNSTHLRPPSNTSNASIGEQGGSISANETLYYEFTPTHNSNFLIETTGTAHIEGKLFDSSLAMIAEDKQGRTLRISQSLSAGQTYYIHLINTDPQHSGNFTLRITDLTPPPPDPNPGDDHSDDFDRPTVISINQLINGNIEVGQDEDIFAFKVSEDISYTIESTGSSDVQVELYTDCLPPSYASSTPSFMESSNNSSGNFILEGGLRNSGDFSYCLKVKHTNTAGTGAYQFSVRKTYSDLIDDHGDSKDKATNLFNKYNNLGMVGIQEIESNPDFFKFSVENSQKYSIRVGGDSDPDIELFIENSDGTLSKIAEDNDSGTSFGVSNGSALMEKDLIAGLNYFLKVIAKYKKELYFVSISPMNNISNLVADNNRFIEDAVAINPGTPLSASFEKAGGNDIDYFELTSTQSGLHSVEITSSDSELNTEACLFKGQLHELIGCNDNGGTDAKSLIRTKFEAGIKYYLKVFMVGANPTSPINYSINFNPINDSNGNLITSLADDYANDTSTTALINNNDTVSGRIERASDEDFFLINSPLSTFATFYLESDSLLELGLYNRDGVYVGAANSIVPAAQPYILENNIHKNTYIVDLNGGDNYYIKVSSPSNKRHIANYDLTLIYSSTTQADLRIQPGKHRDRAHGSHPQTATIFDLSKIYSGENVSGSKFSPHMFKVNVPLSKNYIIETSGTDDPFCTLLKETGFEITSDDNSGVANNCKIEMQLLADKDYYLTVRAANPNQSASYGLRVSELTGAILGAGDYHSDDQLFASELIIGKEERGHMTNGDRDWFEFTVPVNASYRFIGYGYSGNTTVYGTIYNSQGNIIKLGGPLSHPTLPYNVNLQANETYYILASGQGTGWYKLSFNGPNLPESSIDEYSHILDLATEIKEGSTIYGEINYIQNNNQYDVDAFFFEPETDGDFEIKIRTRSSFIPLGISMLIAGTTSTISGNQETINVHLSAGTKYHIYAKSRQPHNNYTPGFYQLSVKRVGGPNQPPEARFGISPNSNLKVFETITFDGSGSFDDVYVSSYSWDFDGDGISDSSLPTVDHSFLSPGTKTISLTVGDTDGLTDTATFDLELSLPNDDFSNEIQNPSTILLNDVVNAEFENDLDKDFFSFTTTDLGTYTIHLDRSSSIFYYKLYDSDLNLLTSALPSNASSFSEQVQLDENSNYVIEVFTANQATGTYTIQVQSPTAIPVTDDHGDEFSNATELSLGVIYDASADSSTDIDAFEFTVTEDAEYVVTSLGQTSISATLYDVYGNQINQDFNQTKDGTNFKIQEQLSPGKYFFKARESNGNSVLPYRVYVYKFIPPTGPPPADNFGQDFQSAFPVRVTKEQAGLGPIDFNNASLNTGNDFIRIVLDPDAREGYYKFYTSGNTDTRGVVYDSDENRIAENNGKIDPQTGGVLPNFEIHVYLEPGKQYYLRISGNGGAYNAHIEPPFYATLDDEFPGHFNNSRDIYNSVPMELDVLYSGSLQSDADHDLFSFTPTITGDYRTTITTSGSSTNNNVSLIGINTSSFGSPLYGIGGLRHYKAGRTYFMRAQRALPVSSGNVPLHKQHHDYTIKIELYPASVEDHPGEIISTQTVDTSFVSQFSQIQVGLPLDGFFGTNKKNPSTLNNFDPAGISSQNNFQALEDIDTLLFIPERTDTYDIEVFSFEGPCIYLHPAKNLGDTIDPLDRASSPNPAGRQCTGHSSLNTLTTSAQFNQGKLYFIELDHQLDRLPESYKITIKEKNPVAISDPSDLVANNPSEADSDSNSQLTLPVAAGLTVNASEDLHIRDFDVYKLIVNRGGDFKFSLGTNQIVYTVMELLDGAGNILANNKPALSNSYQGEFNFILNESVDYYLRISKEKFYEETGSFNLSISPLSAISLDDHSNAAANASEIPYDQCTQGYLPTDDDIDQLYISPPVTGTYIVNGSTRGSCTSGSSSNDQKIKYDSYTLGQPSGYLKLPLDSSGNPFGGLGPRTLLLEAGKKYYLQYSICSHCTDVGNRYFHVRYALDPNNLPADDHPNDIAGAQGSNSLTLLEPSKLDQNLDFITAATNSEFISGQVETAGDKDYFMFTSTEQGKHLIKLFDANQEFRIKLFDNSGNLLDSAEATNANALDLNLPAYNLKANQNYYIEVAVRNASWIGSYKLAVIKPGFNTQNNQSEISHVSFDGNLDDSIRGLTYFSSNSGETYVPGLSGDAVSLDGSIVYLIMNNFNERFHELSYCMWVKSNTSEPANREISLIRSQMAHNELLVYGDGRIKHETKTVNGDEEFTASNSLDIEKWHHYCQSVKSNSESKAYVDGNLIDSQNITGNLTSDKLNSFLVLQNETNPFNGFIDELKIYNFALSDTEISTIYQQLKSEADDQNNEAPIADFTVTLTTANVNQAIGFDASVSTDADNNIVSYEWDFDNDGIIDSNSAQAGYNYTTAGTFTPRLVVTDAFGESSEKIGAAIIVSNPLPSGAINIPATASAESPITISSSFTDPDGGQLTILYDFGNGEGDILTSSDPSQTTIYTYDSPGNYTITLTIFDDEGDSIARTGNIQVYAADDHGDFTNPTTLTEIDSVSGATQFPADQDWFEFIPSQAGLFLFESNTNDQIFMTVFDGSQTQIPAISGTFEKYLAFELTAGERYLIKLAGPSQSAANFQESNYDLSVKHIDSQSLPLININHSILPGNISYDNIIYHPLQVVDVMANSNIPNVNSSQLVKWTVRRTADYEVRVNFNSKALIIVYDDNLDVIDQSFKEENTAYLYPTSLTEGDTIYIRVIKLSTLAQAFSVFIEQVVNVTPTNDDAPDDSANALDLGSTDELNPILSNKSISYLTDVDWFKFDVAGTGSFKIYTDGATKPARPAGSDQNNWISSNLEGCLYHSSDLNTALTCSSRKDISSSGIYTQGGANFEIANYAHSTGTYYLRVKHTSILGSTSYSLNIKTSHFLDSNEDTELVPGQALNGEFETPSDLTDFLRFTPPETGTYTINFNNGGSTEYDARVAVDIPFDIPVSAKHSYYDNYQSPSNSNSMTIEMIKGLEYGIAISAVKDPRLYNRDDALFLNGNNLYGISITQTLGRPIQLDTTYTGTFAYSGFEDNYNIYEHEVTKAGFYELHDGQAGDNFLPRYDGHVIYPVYSTTAKNPHPTGLITALQTNPTEEYGPNYPNGYADSFGYIHPSAKLRGYRFRSSSNNDRLIIIPKAAFIKQYHSANYNFSLSYDDLPDEISELDSSLDILELNITRSQELNTADDIDLLQFTVPSDGKYRIKNHPSLDLQISPAGQNLDSLVLTTAPNNSNWYLELDLQAGVTYNLEISKRANSPALSYPLITNLELTASPDEHGNTYQNATLLSTGQGATGSLDHGVNIVEADHDFFKLTVNNDDFYNFEDTQGTSIRKLYKWNSANQDIELVQVFDSTNGFDHKYLLASEEYYLEVTTTNNNQGLGYLVPLNVWTPTNDDISNETAGASSLTVSYPASTFNGTIDYEEDFDWLKIDVDTSNFASGNFGFELSGDEGIRAEFHDNSNPPLAYRSGSPIVLETSSSNPIDSQTVSLTNGIYFIKVFHSDRLLKNKNYSIKIIQPDDHPDAQGTARIGLNTITPIQAILNNSTDKDVFRLPVSDPTRLVIRSEGNLNLAYRIHFSLQNIGGITHHNANHFFSTDRDTSNNFNVIGNTYNVSSRAYYLEVYSPTGDEGLYDIILESYTPPVRPADDYPNKQADAAPILFNTEITGNLDYDFDPVTFEVEDTDYFKFYVSQYGYYRFDTDTNMSMTCGGTVYNIFPNTERLLYQNRTCYLRAAPSISGGTGPYRFKIIPRPHLTSDGSFGTASFTRSPNTVIEVGDSIDFDASASTIITGAITSYDWDFDGDGVVDESNPTASTSHTFNTLGTFDVTLTISNATDSATRTQTITVVPQDDHGNDDTSATALVLNTLTDGSIELSGDVDSFSYTSTGCGVYEATLTDRDVDFRLTGPNLIPSIGVVYPAGNNPNYNPSFVLLDGETQFLNVTADNLGFNGAYKITVSEKPYAVTQALPFPQAITANPNEQINFTGQKQRIPFQLPADYEWDFEADGTIDFSSTNNQASISYPQPGTYTVYQYIKDCNGLSKLEQIFDITINNLHPSGDMGVLNASQYITDTFEFYTTGLNDPDGGLLSLDWDFGDGNSLSGLSDDTNITTPTHLYNSKGNFVVTLTITDDEGSSFSKTQPVSVVNRAPIARLAYSSIKTTHIGSIFAANSDDPDGCIDKYEWDINNDGVYETDLGIDNSSFPAFPIGGGPSCPNLHTVLHHHFRYPGNYTMGLRVTDNDGATATTTLNYTVDNLPPRGGLPGQASIFTNPNRASFFINEEIEFSTDIYDPDDTDGQIGEMAVTWDFGDGSIPVTGTVDTTVVQFLAQLDPSNSLSKPTHRYQAAGTYTVTLTVTDKDGANFTVTKQTMIDPRNADDFPDTEAEAHLIYLDKFMPGTAIQGHIENPSDRDLFKLKIANVGLFKLSFTQLSQGYELNQLSGNAVIARQPNSPTEFIILGQSGDEAIFEIKHSDPAFLGTYDFTIYDDFAFSGAGLSPDDHEDLDIFNATVIPMTPDTDGLFPLQTGSIDYADDFDLFKFEYNAQGRPADYDDYQAVLNMLSIAVNQGDGDAIYDILDENGKLIITMQRSQAISPIYFLDAEPAKTYYIRVKGDDAQVANIPYTLSIAYLYPNDNLPKKITVEASGDDDEETPPVEIPEPSPPPAPVANPAPASPGPITSPPEEEKEVVETEKPKEEEQEIVEVPEEPEVKLMPFTINGFNEDNSVVKEAKLTRKKKAIKLVFKRDEIKSDGSQVALSGPMNFEISIPEEFKKLVKIKKKKFKLNKKAKLKIKFKNKKAFKKNLAKLSSYYNPLDNSLTIPLEIKELNSGSVITNMLKISL